MGAHNDAPESHAVEDPSASYELNYTEYANY